ncbi:hypothetical protein EPO15_11910 [bacterium]|nr:MAG: hypothetical protein EPO15_11910 [bacterium]
MATKRQILAAMLATPLTLAGMEADAAMPDFESPPGLYKDIEVPSVGPGVVIAPSGAPAVEARKAACPIPSLDGAQIRGRMFSSVTDIKNGDGSPFGTIDSEGSGWVVKYKDGSTIAKATETGDDETRTIAVTGCEGEPVGTITVKRAGWRGERVIEAKDASGAVIGTSGSVDYLQGSWRMGAVSYEDDHWLLDSWRIRGPGDGRIAAIAAMANSEANRRESQTRNREREHGHGRGDR